MTNTEDTQPRHLAGDTFYIPGLANSGLIGGLAIDTSPDESVYDDIVVEQLIVTHGHADHFSSAAELRRRGTRVIAGREDASLIEYPEVNVRGMFSWAKPGDTFVTKLFRGEGCSVDGYLDAWSHPRVTAIPLPGHTLGHSGVLTDDGVLFTGDALYLEPLWVRHALPYAIDPDLVAASLETIRRLDFDWLVPGHGVPVRREEADRHIDHHIGQIREIEGLIVGLLAEPRTTEEIIALVNRARGIVENPAQYWLAVTTVKGFLGDLLGRGAIEFYVRDHMGYWSTV